MFTKDDSKQEISVEKLKSKIIEKLSPRMTEAIRKLVEVDTSINGLSQAIEDVANKMFEAETNLQRLQDKTVPDKKTLAAISNSILELQTLKQTFENWSARLEALQEERAGLLHGVKQGVERAFGAVRAEVWGMVEARAATLQAFLVSTEKVMEECRWVDRYVPCLKGIDEVVPYPMYKGCCPPVDLAKYLHENSRWWGSSSIQLEGECK